MRDRNLPALHTAQKCVPKERRNNTAQKRDVFDMPYFNYTKLSLVYHDRNRFGGHPSILH